MGEPPGGLPSPPSFFIIGAMKSGTSSLYEYLRTHPEICMSTIKETNYLIAEKNWSKGLDWYLSLFPDRSRLCGEASAGYTKRHVFPGVPQRMHAIAPDARLIYVLRDPITRIVSHYVHACARGRERQSFTEAIKPPNNNYVLTSKYFYQIEAFREYFPEDRILIVSTDELEERTHQTVQAICRFIGANPDFQASGLDRRFNVSAENKHRTVVDTYVRDNRLRRVLNAVLPAAVTRPTRVEPPTLTDADRAHLQACLDRDVQQLRAFTGMALKEWSL
jgi:Sulfotransferase domain